MKLKPCPFCGREPNESKFQDESLWSHNIVWKYKIGCMDCDVQFVEEDEEEVIESWNTRKETK